LTLSPLSITHPHFYGLPRIKTSTRTIFQQKSRTATELISPDFSYRDQKQAGQVESVVTYPVDRYLMLLNTYSPYLQLDSLVKDALFRGLRDKIENDLGGSLQLSYLSAFHVAQKC
jgi:hypothetical protein